MTIAHSRLLFWATLYIKQKLKMEILRCWWCKRRRQCHYENL